MSDTVYENKGIKTTEDKQTTISATRYWGGSKRKDCIQITLDDRPGDVMYACMTLKEFRKMNRAIEKNVRDTKDAWWHKINDRTKIRRVQDAPNQTLPTMR